MKYSNIVNVPMLTGEEIEGTVTGTYTEAGPGDRVTPATPSDFDSDEIIGLHEDINCKEVDYEALEEMIIEKIED